MEGLSAYIPEDRRQAMARGEALPDRTTGAALFADLSGFTPMTEALTRAYGPHRGAEELTRQLGLVFGALIHQVDAYRGAVIGFSGDAITCWFDGDTDGLRATAASLAMQEAMAPFGTIPLAGGESTSLRVKTAVVVGPVRRFLVGDPDIQLIDAVAGETLDLLADAERHAESGEVVVAEAIARATPAPTVREWRDGSVPGRCFAVVDGMDEYVQPKPWPELTDDALSEEDLGSWVLPGVYERLRQGLGGFLADFRPAAALFLSFHGIDYDGDEGAGQKLDRFVRWVQGRIAAYEGSLVQLTIGDKGSSYLYASFGAPVAHDDDAVRAVAVGLEIQALAPGLEFVQDLRIGVTHGQMYAGAYGSASRRTYGVLGAKTNLSARLMGKAQPGQILCDEEIARRAGKTFTFTSLGTITVKGKQEGVPIFAPAGRIAAASEQVDGSAEGPLIGRRGDLTALEAIFDEVAAGDGRITFLAGDAGIGKTRLVRALAQGVRARAATVLVGAGQSGAQQLPYRVWRDVFSALFGIADAVPEDQRGARVREAASAAAPDLVEQVPLLNDILALGLPETAATSSLEPSARQEALSGLLIALLRSAAARAPLVVILEDAQRLDSLSWDLAERIARTLLSELPMWLVIVHRPLEEEHVGARAVGALHGLPESGIVEMAPLEHDDLVELAAVRLGLRAADVPPVVANLLRDRANGNPFIAEELLQTLRDQGLLSVEDEAGERACRVSPELALGRFTLPDTVQGLILSRLDRLPADRQLVLKVASVIGRMFAMTPLRDTLGRLGWAERSLKPSLLRELTRSGFVHPESVEPELSYLFRHIITHEIVYLTLLYAQRRQVHQAVAEWYARSFGDEDVDGVPILAHHWSHAAEGSSDPESLETATRYLIRAGERAGQLCAYPEAMAYYRRGLALLTDHDALQPTRATLLVRLGQVEERTGAYAAAGEHLEEARTLGGRLGNLDEVVLQAITGLTSIALRKGDYAGAERLGEQALEMAIASGDASRAADIRTRLGALAAYQNEFAVATERLEAALQYFTEVDDTDSLSYVLNTLGVTALFQNDYGAAGDHFTRALPLAQASGDRDTEARILGNLGLVAEHQGDHDAARRQYQESRTILESIGSREGVVQILNNLGDVAVAQRRFEEAREAYLEALHGAMDLGSESLAVYAVCGMAALLIEEGAPRLAAPLLGLVVAHPATNTAIEQKATPLLDRLRTMVPEPELEEALARGRATTLEAVAESLTRASA